MNETGIDKKIEEAGKLLKKGKKDEFEELLSELFLERHGKLTKEQKDKLDEVFAFSRGIKLDKEENK